MFPSQPSATRQALTPTCTTLSCNDALNFLAISVTSLYALVASKHTEDNLGTARFWECQPCWP